MKCSASCKACTGIRSHPTWGAWIEIGKTANRNVKSRSHPTWGAWIEIRILSIWAAEVYWSHPTWGAWIEIQAACNGKQGDGRRTPHGVRGLKSKRVQEKLSSTAGRTPHGVRGLKLPACQTLTSYRWSHPTWGAWIEIPVVPLWCFSGDVAPHMGCVD